MSGGRRAAELVDGIVPEPVLVVGSSPDAGKDLDLLTRPKALTALVARLSENGWARRDDVFITVEDGCCLVVDVESTLETGLPAAAIDELFAAALQIDGFRSLVRPAPHHDLLLLARRFGSAIHSLSAAHRERLAAVGRSDPRAWERARSRAAGWGLQDELTELDRVARSGPRSLSAPRRVIARMRQRSLRRGAVVAVSGVDGAGKSTQAQVVADGLRVLGFEASVQWTRITYDPSLDRIARPVKTLLSLRRRREADCSGPGADLSTGSARALREQSRFVGAVWVTIVAAVDALVLRRSARMAIRAGAVVVRDRYTLDSVVQLLDQYGSDYRTQTRLIARSAPQPRAAFLLDVSAETAFQRKPEEYDVAALSRHRQRYLALAAELGVRVVDGERAPDVISQELLVTAWDELRS